MKFHIHLSAHRYLVIMILMAHLMIILHMHIYHKIQTLLHLPVQLLVGKVYLKEQLLVIIKYQRMEHFVERLEIYHLDMYQLRAR